MRRLHCFGFELVFAVLLLAGAWVAQGGAEPAVTNSATTNSAGTNSAGTSIERRAYEEAKAAYTKEPTKPVVAWKFASACFDLIDPGEKNPQRAKVAQEGIGAAEGALAQDPKSAPAHYYLALNLGELARTKTLGALRLVSRMEREFLAAIELDEHFDHAGAERSLGILYRDAPVIGSVGSRSKARQHLKRAVELEPDFPDNRMALLEAYVKWGDWNEAREQLKALDELWPAAQKAFAGEAWVSSWVDWGARVKLCRGKVANHPPK
jgi:tetratricopeptide (TPR) repeat protein